MNELKLCEVLGVEVDEEFQFQDPNLIYHIDNEGHMYFKEKNCEWIHVCDQYSLEEMIQKGIIKVSKAGIKTPEQYYALEAISKIFGAKYLYRGETGLYFYFKDKAVCIPKGTCLDGILDGLVCDLSIHRTLMDRPKV